MKKRFNPLTLLLSSVELIDFFDVAMVGLETYASDCCFLDLKGC